MEDDGRQALCEISNAYQHVKWGVDSNPLNLPLTYAPEHCVHVVTCI